MPGGSSLPKRQFCAFSQSSIRPSAQSLRIAHKVTRMQQRAASGSAPATKNPFLLPFNIAEFKEKEAKRHAFDRSSQVKVSQTPEPDWTYGNGVNNASGQGLKHIEIDPYGDDRQMISNYKLLIAGVPRPISFVSTVSKDGKKNLSPFSYFQVVDHDPPIFVIGFSGRATRPKDTRANLVETGECVISVVSEHMIEAVNATSLDVPKHVSEWELSGLHPAPSSTVRPERVRDAIFTIEGKLLEMKELAYGPHGKDKPAGALAIIQGTRFWVREDALNEGKDDIKLEALKPLVQLGGIAYGRVRETFELPRPGLKAELKDESRGLQKFVDEKDLE